MTPRRIVLTIFALMAFGFVYAIYNRLFGWIDGLPLLPGRMLIQNDSTIQPPNRPTSPTIERLKQAFGDKSPETEPAFYPMQLGAPAAGTRPRSLRQGNRPAIPARTKSRCRRSASPSLANRAPNTSASPVK